LPRLSQIEVGRRLRVVFGPDDLFYARANVYTDGISGYDPKTAAELAARVLTYVRRIGN